MTSPVTFVKETQDELRKVTWPKRDEVFRLTFAVIIISIGVGLFIGGLDFVFTRLLQLFIH